MDIGRDPRSKNVDKLAKVIEREFIDNWLDDNEQNFVEAMNLVKESNPAKFADLYLKAKQMRTARESNVNININRQRDYDDLEALMRSRQPQQLENKPDYTPYIEMPEKAVIDKEYDTGE